MRVFKSFILLTLIFSFTCLSALSQSKTKTKTKKLRWPKFSIAQKDIINLKIRQLLHGKKEIVQKAVEKLKAFGPGVIPFVMRKIKDSEPNCNKYLEEIALSVMDKKYIPLVYPYLKNKRKSVRTIALKLLEKFPTKEGIAKLKKAFEKEKDEQLKEELSLALCTFGDISYIDILFEITKKNFFKKRDRILKSAAGIKGEKAEKWLIKKLEQGKVKDKIAALRLLAVAGTKNTARKIKKYMYHKNYTIALAALNAIRSLIEGKKPLEHISVFELVRMRKEWEEKL